MKKKQKRARLQQPRVKKKTTKQKERARAIESALLDREQDRLNRRLTIRRAEVQIQTGAPDGPRWPDGTLI